MGAVKLYENGIKRILKILKKLELELELELYW